MAETSLCPKGLADEAQHVKHVTLARGVRAYKHGKWPELQIELSDTLEVASPDPRD